MSTDDAHDAASNIARLAGVTTGGALPVVPPSVLIARFCVTTAKAYADAGVASRAHGPERDEAGNMVSRGFCGYMGGRGDLMVTGFDDGYTFMGYLGERGWRDLPRKGDWPYVVYMRWPASTGPRVATVSSAELAGGPLGAEHHVPPAEPETIIEYCEADLTVWQFDNHGAAQQFYARLKDAP